MKKKLISGKILTYSTQIWDSKTFFLGFASTRC